MVEDAAGTWSQPDGTGYTNDIVKASYAAVGIEVTLQVVPYARCKNVAIEGGVAGCFSMSAGPEFEGTIKFADEPMFTANAQYYRSTTNKKTASIKDQNGIKKGTIIGVVLDYEYPSAVFEMKKRGVVFETAKAEKYNLQKVEADRIDFAIINVDGLKTDAEILSEAGVGKTVVPVFSGGTMNAFIGFSVKHPQGEMARKKFNEGRSIIGKNGTLATIAAKWNVHSKQ